MSSISSIASGMSAATQRFQTAATNIASGSGDLDQSAIELMMSKISLEAEAKVAAVIAQTADRLLDITV